MKQLFSVLQENPDFYIEKDHQKYPIEAGLKEEELLALLKDEDSAFVITNGPIRFYWEDNGWHIFHQYFDLNNTPTNSGRHYENLSLAIIFLEDEIQRRY